MSLKPLRTSLSAPRMPRTSIPPSIVAEDTAQLDVTILRATAATPAVRQLARPTRMYSTGVAPLSAEAERSLGGRRQRGIVGAVALVPRQDRRNLRPLTGCGGAVLPLTGCPPLELRRLGCFGERFSGAQEGLDVDAALFTGVSVAVIWIPLSFFDGEVPPGDNACSSDLAQYRNSFSRCAGNDGLTLRSARNEPAAGHRADARLLMLSLQGGGCKRDGGQKPGPASEVPS